MSETVIRVENVSKQYRLGVIGHGSLARDLQSWWARRRGKQDPNAKIVDRRPPTPASDGPDRFWALRNIELEVRRGEVLGIIGRNGAGKSTLLKILSRVTAPTRGRVRAKGRIASLLEVGTGFHPELTGRENIFLNGAILGMQRAEIRRKLDEIVSFAEIERFIDTPVKRYSSGMYVRLAFAVAAHLEPEILVVDEVLAVGDTEFQQKCLGKMESAAGQGRTVLFVSHRMQAIRRLCSRCVLLDEGRLGSDGDTSAVVDRYLCARPHTAAARTLPRSAHRIFTGDFETLQVRFRDRTGRQSTALRTGEPFSIEILFRIHNPQKAYRLGMVLRSMDETDIAMVRSAPPQGPFWQGNAHATYLAAVRIDNLLTPGRYHINLSVKSRTNEYVDAVDAIDFTVLPEDADTGPAPVGLVRMHTEWDLPQPINAPMIADRRDPL